ncbi:MAG: hypothetical protein Q9188_007044 [Gyalolechia gomerana]
MSMQYCLVTDFADILITVGKLQLGPSEMMEYRLKYHEEGELPRPDVKASRVKISLLGPVPTSKMLRYLHSVPGNSTDLEDGLKQSIQALNIVVNTTPNENPTIYRPSRSVFAEFPRTDNLSMKAYDSIDLGGGLIRIRGYYSSTKTSTARILLNLHGQCSPFYPEINLLELMRIYWDSGNDLYTLEKFVQKLRVRFRYMEDDKHQVIEKIKTICGFSHARNEMRDAQGQVKTDSHGNTIWTGNADRNYGSSTAVKFECSKYPPSISVADYFSREHGISLKGPGAPVTNFGSDAKPIWIPAELGIVLPGQVYKGKLSDDQTSKMLRIAARDPAENARRLVGTGAQVIGIQANNPKLSAFGVSIDTKMIVVPARILKPPQIEYGNKRSFTPTNASWNLAGLKFYYPKPLENWSILRCGNSTFTSAHIQVLRNQIKQYGLGDAPPSPAVGYHTNLGIADDDKTDKPLKTVFRKAKEDKVRFLFVILETKSKPVHARLKLYADIWSGIHHTTLVSPHFMKQYARNDRGVNYLANVMQKVNVKIGGINHILSSEGSPLEFLTTSPTMLVGIDVSHPAPKSMAEAPSTTSIQEGRVEMVARIGELMGKRLSLFGRQYKQGPHNIIIYRDGVSEGQFKTVLREEVSAIEEVCYQKYDAVNQTRPKIVVIICGKRHHTRFYPTRTQDADERHNFNPKNGTVVDRGVSSEKFYDFYLQPHAALTATVSCDQCPMRQSTLTLYQAKPEHCTVIRDDIKMGPDVLHKITHNLSYLYARATKAVSLCPPGQSYHKFLLLVAIQLTLLKAYYADIMCERGNKYLAKYLNQQWPPGTAFESKGSPWLEGFHDE